MGFFDLKAICAVCDGEAGLHRYRIANKEWVCPTCYKKAGSSLKKFIAKATADEIREAIAKTSNNSAELDHFKATKKIGTLVEFDDHQKNGWYCQKYSEEEIVQSFIGTRTYSTLNYWMMAKRLQAVAKGERLLMEGILVIPEQWLEV
ncbi:hypothetical protein JCM19047_2283 [Bacillus sp. JCM 19047]|nr:hypothetical protein JCM19047_2283 [Bacillus sp. JCM 19047]